MAALPAPSGEAMHALCARLYPLMRSITGDGVRRTLASLAEYAPISVHEVPSGTAVFDWNVPPEWNIREAYIADERGNRVVDLARHSLHVVSYSDAVRRKMSLEELQPHLHSLPEHPEWIPYRTSYYARTWGFCLAHARRQALRPGTYEVVIDSRLEPGSLSYGECIVPGDSDEEVVVWAHICHPSLANDNLSGIAVATFLAVEAARRAGSLRRTHRFVFAPSTIGAITWLARNREQLGKIVAGVVISGVGDAGGFTYKRSRSGRGAIDRLFGRCLERSGEPHRTVPFSPYGYDERQFCSPGLDLPVGCWMRTPYGQYPEYHTSADDLSFIRPRSLESSLALCSDVLGELERVRAYDNLAPTCEPQLGRRGLYDTLGGESDKKSAQMALLWMLNYSDGKHSTLDISELSGLGLDVLERAAARLCDAELLRPRRGLDA